MTIFIAIIGYLAGFFGVIAFIPQAIKTIKTKNTKEISLKTYLIYELAVLLFLLLAILSIALPIMYPDGASKTQIIIWGITLILPYSVTMVGVACILTIKIQNIYKFNKNKKNNQLINQDQFELTQMNNENTINSKDLKNLEQIIESKEVNHVA